MSARAGGPVDISGNIFGTLGPGVYRVVGELEVEETFTLTLLPGVIFKFDNTNQSLRVRGTLIAAGTPGNPVVFTSWKDDTWGGDSNGDGIGTEPEPGDWRGVLFYGTSTGSVIDHAVLRYHGQAFRSGIHAEEPGFDAQMTNTLIEHGGLHAVDLSGFVCDFPISNCSFQDNTLNAVEDLRIGHVPMFTDNTASGNGEDAMRVMTGATDGDHVIGPSNLLGDTLVFEAAPDILAGHTLTLLPGTVFKFAEDNISVRVRGALDAQGTDLEPVVFTSLRDDAHGGDTNNDGAASLPTPGDWRGIAFFATAAGSVLDRVLVRYHGNTFRSALFAEEAGFSGTVTNSVLELGARHAVDFSNLANGLTISGCEFRDNLMWAVEDVQINQVANFSDNVASGNGGDYMVVSGPEPVGVANVAPENYPGEALVFDVQCEIAPGNTLNLAPGTVIKMDAAAGFLVSGALNAAGDFAAPVVFTSFDDDEVAGDTDGDGAATPGAPGQWRGLEFLGGTNASTLRHVQVRFAGAAGFDGFVANAAQLDMAHVRVQSALADGFVLQNAASARDLVAHDCGGDGFEFTGNVAAKRLTAAGNGGFGLRRVVGATNVRSAVAFGNTAGGYTGFVPGSVTHSLGTGLVHGVDGNLVEDPEFTNLAAGDLTLLSSSPCIDTGDPTDFATEFDAGGFPRWTDGDLNGLRRMDMGAHEFSNVQLAVSGSLTPGGTIDIDITGLPGMNLVLFASTERLTGFNFFMFGAFGPSPTGVFLQFPFGQIPRSVSLPIPAFEGSLPLFVQVLAVDGPVAKTTPGNLSNLFVTTVE